MKIDEITERLKKIRKEIEDAFEKELIDFDEIEQELSAAIDALENGGSKSTGRFAFVPKPENYI